MEFPVTFHVSIRILLDAPESINEAPYEAWFMKVENVTGTAQLMSAAEYEEYVKTLD